MKKKLGERIAIFSLKWLSTAAVSFMAGPAWCGNLVVNIDNPQFREVVAAIPDFALSKTSTDSISQDVANEANAELKRLLNFSGIFKLMGEAAYKDLMVKAQPNWYSDVGLGTVNVLDWKTTGVESLTLAEVSHDKPTTWSIQIRTIDVGRREVLVGKKYSQIERNQVIAVMRRYGDEILHAYTGKSGIFNSKLVFVARATENSAKQIYISDFDGSHAYPITRGNYPHLSPQFSPDGKYVVYTSYEDSNPDMYIYDIAAKTYKKLSGQKGINSGGTFDITGRLVAFTGSVNGDSDIYTILPSGGARKPFITGPGIKVDPAFSPDNSKIAYVSGRYGNPHIFVADLKWATPFEPKVLGDKRITYAGWYNVTPVWSPDGDRIVFAGFDREIDRYDLFLVNPDGTKLERLTLQTGDNERPFFSPNGQNIIFMSNRTETKNVKGHHQLYIMNRDGSNQRPLVTGLYETQTAFWGKNQ